MAASTGHVCGRTTRTSPKARIPSSSTVSKIAKTHSSTAPVPYPLSPLPAGSRQPSSASGGASNCAVETPLSNTAASDRPSFESKDEDDHSLDNTTHRSIPRYLLDQLQQRMIRATGHGDAVKCETFHFDATTWAWVG